MAIIKGLIRKMKGSVGDFTFRRNSGSTVVSEKITATTNKRTSAQLKQRTKLGNIVHMYRGISPLLNMAFENKEERVSDYNMFVKLNSLLTPVYLTHNEVTAGACVAAPYQITQGSLPAIVTSGEKANTVTDISLGSLAITAGTTVAEFSNAVVENNSVYNYGEQISFFSVLQRVNAATGIPFCEFGATAVVLSKESNVLLWSLVNKAGFANVNGYLGHGDDEGDGVFCWVHSRKKNGETQLSTQFLINNNTLLESYTDQNAYEQAADSYGGETEVFLSPDTESKTKSTSGSSGGSGTDSGGSSTGGGTSGGSTDTGGID